jgi:hypothetical protein
MERIRPGFVVTGSVLLLIALLLFLYAVTYRPKPAPPAEFEAQIDYPPAAIAKSEPTQLSSPKVTVNKTKHHSNSNRQFHHVPTQSISTASAQTKDSTPCVAQAKKVGFFARVLNFFKRLLGSRPNSPPVVCAVKASRTSLFRVCPPGESSETCEVTSQEVVLNALAADADNDLLLYTWSVTGGTLSGEGRMVTWDLSGVANGTYTATVEVNDGNQHTANNSTIVTLADCADCKRPPPTCPTVSVSCTGEVEVDEPITFTASVSGGLANTTYNWSISAGTIIRGQGTSTITVDTTGLGDQSVTATVSVGGADPSCTGTTSSCTTSVKSRGKAGLQPLKFDEYSVIRFDDEKSRLDAYAFQLESSPGSRGAIIVYGSCAGEASRYANQAKDYLVNTRGIDAGRIETFDGGCRVEPMTQLWVVPIGAEMPSLDTAGSISPCRECAKGPRPTRPRPENSKITGRVFDENNNAIANAKVTLIGENGFSEKGKTHDNGEFAFDALPAGRYDLMVEADGFEEWRGENLELAEGETNPIPDGTIQVSHQKVITRFKRRDVIRIDYPDHFIDAPPAEITFNWNRTSRTSEIVTTQTNQNGQINIEKRRPDIPGAKPGEPAITAHGPQYTAFATVTLLTDDLTVISSPATMKQSLTAESVSWTWKVKPANRNSKIASFRFHVEVVWEGEGLPPQPPFRFDLGDPFIAEVGLPLRVKIATYSAPPSAFFGLFTFGFGFRRRKRSLTAAAEAEAPPSVAGVAEEAIEEDVSSSIFAPRQASPGSSFLVQVYAHLAGEEPAALKAKAALADPEGQLVGNDPLDQKVKRGSTLTFSLSMNGLKIDEPQQDREWNGRTIGVQFGVTVPENFEPRSIYGLVVISADTVPIGHFRFAFKIVATPEPQSDEPLYLGALTRFRCAFISYAHEDLAEVLKRVQMLNIQTKKYFQDLINIPPGERWEPAIFKAIDKSDVIFLFWSKAASGSEWVRKEILYAIKRQAGDENAPPVIYPVIIEGPPPAPPPAELNFLQFNDDFSYRIFAAEATAPRKSQDH